MAFDGLHAKYVEMRLLRTSPSANDVRPRLRALAARFPGSLREIDELPLDEIDRRIEALESVAAGRAPSAWMTAMDRFHALTRTALLAKRWLAARRHVDELTRAAFVAAHDDVETRSWAEHLSRLASPPSGRITHVVLERLAREREISVAELRALVHSHARVSRSSQEA